MSSSPVIDTEAVVADAADSSSPPLADPSKELEIIGPSSPPKIQRRSLVESDGNGGCTEKGGGAAFVGDVDETANSSPLLQPLVTLDSSTKGPAVAVEDAVAGMMVVEPLESPLPLPLTALVSTEDPSDSNPVVEPVTAAVDEPNGAVGCDTGAVSLLSNETKGVSSGDAMLEKFSLLSVQAQEIKKSETVSISKKAAKPSPSKRPVASPNRKQQSTTPSSTATNRTVSSSTTKPVHPNPSSAPRAAALPKVSASNSQKPPAKSPTNRSTQNQESVPHYALPKDTSRSASSKEARDMYECSKKFKALPISPVVKNMLSPRSYLKKPSLPMTKSFHSPPPFKALPMPDFKAAHAKAITIASPKQVTKPIPFYFRTEKRIMARQGIGSMISTSSFRFTKTNIAPTPSPQAVATAKSPRKARSAPTKPLPSPPSQRAAPKKSRPKLDVNSVASTKTPEISATSTLDQDLDRLLDDEDQAELDRLLNDRGDEEGEVTFDNDGQDAEADALNELLDEPLNLEPTGHQSATPESKPLAEQRSPDDVQAVNLGLFHQTADH
jgi:hypothetical protein